MRTLNERYFERELAKSVSYKRRAIESSFRGKNERLETEAGDWVCGIESVESMCEGISLRLTSKSSYHRYLTQRHNVIF